MSIFSRDPLLERAQELLFKELVLGPTSLWLKPPSTLSPPNEGCRFVHPWKPSHSALLEASWKAHEGGRYEQGIVFAGKHKQESREMLKYARGCCQKEVYFLSPNDYGGKSWAKEFRDSSGLLRVASGRKSKLLLLEPSPEPAELFALRSNGDGYHSCPGLFSWDSVDQGSKLLVEFLRERKLNCPLVDLGAGWGYLAANLARVGQVHLLEADSRGLKACETNLNNPQAHFHWVDASLPGNLPESLIGRAETVLCNPPFHTAKKAQSSLGLAFINSAHHLLRKGGRLYLVANQHLPYGKTIQSLFRESSVHKEDGSFHIYEATK